MTPDEVLAVLREAIVTVLEVAPETVTRSTLLVDDLGADSLALAEIVDIAEGEIRTRARVDFTIDDADLDDIATVGQAVDYVVGRL